MKEYLKEMLDNYEIDGRGKETYDCFATDANIFDIRDFLSENGNILVEDLNTFLYIATISAGVKKMNYAVTALKLDNGKLHAYTVAREGLFNQHTSQKAIEKVKAEFLNGK